MIISPTPVVQNLLRQCNTRTVALHRSGKTKYNPPIAVAKIKSVTGPVTGRVFIECSSQLESAGTGSGWGCIRARERDYLPSLLVRRDRQ
eukprot:4545532-Pleurochrysis_carterae.AAC.1